MSKKLRNVVRTGGDWVIPVLSLETKVEMEEGLLFAIDDSDGKAVLADQASNKHAVGVVYKTSPEGFGEAFQLNGANKLKAGEYIDVFTHAILYTDVDLSGKKVGDPVYLGASGKITAEKPGSNTVQCVGVVANPAKGIVRLAIMAKGDAYPA